MTASRTQDNTMLGIPRPDTPVSTSNRRVPAVIAASVLAALAFAGPARAGGIVIVDDLSVGTWSPFAERWESEAGVCVWGGGEYRVTASSADGGAFALRDGQLAALPYELSFFQGEGAGEGERLTANVPSRYGIPGSRLQSCGGGTNARIRVRVDGGAIQSAAPGIYADSLMLTLSPL